MFLVVDVKYIYILWDFEDMEKYCMQFIWRESCVWQKVKGFVMFQYDNMILVMQDDLGGIYVIYLCSKLDFGKIGFFLVVEGKESCYVVKVISFEGEDCFYRRYFEVEMDRVYYYGGYGSMQLEKLFLLQKQSSLRSRKFFDMGCSFFEYRVYQEVSYRQFCELKNGFFYFQGVGQLDYGFKGILDIFELVSYYYFGVKYVVFG